ncbi:RHS repeat domain-containing protein [Rathayibacter toxicus]|uniref:RHS repeat domain-containing protein n=1 Tax=Rathayibacter toxicus TaxID=145458 RepID=UPI00168D802E|nr:RHS repeat domain-containing protein [Rathayibacter toxicus]QOD10931.1 hypothetical protein BSG36_02920 [Rathayibacter toxicus]
MPGAVRYRDRHDLLVNIQLNWFSRHSDLPEAICYIGGICSGVHVLAWNRCGQLVGRDGEGRLVRVSGFEGVVEYGYDGACQLVESRGRVVSSWRYDVGGRVVSEMVAGRSVVNSYDVAGQLVRSVGGDGSVSEFVYDGLGRRVRVRGADGGSGVLRGRVVVGWSR